MHRLELIALRCKKVRWEALVATLPKALEALGLAHDDGAKDGSVILRDHGDDGCLVFIDHCALARRAALQLATRTQTPVEVFEVVATSGGKRNRFRTTASKATATGELLPAEGAELDLEDDKQTWGGGELDDQAQRVLEAFALLEGGSLKTVELGYKKKPLGRPSTPRVATLLASLQKAKSHAGVPQKDGRIELRIELAAGGRQISFCTVAEHEELERLLGGGK
jgi:hypothetical protein